MPRDRLAGPPTVDDPVKRTVVTESGTDDGQVATVEFDESGYRLSHVEVSPGFIKGNKHVPASHVTSLGGDVVVVADDVVAESAPVSVDPA